MGGSKRRPPCQNCRARGRQNHLIHHIKNQRLFAYFFAMSIIIPPIWSPPARTGLFSQRHSTHGNNEMPAGLLVHCAHVDVCSFSNETKKHFPAGHQRSGVLFCCERLPPLCNYQQLFWIEDGVRCLPHTSVIQKGK